jgi:hypothetical protein
MRNLRRLATIPMLLAAISVAKSEPAAITVGTPIHMIAGGLSVGLRFTRTVDGVVGSLGNSDPDAFFHPNTVGHGASAGLILTSTIPATPVITLSGIAVSQSKYQRFLESLLYLLDDPLFAQKVDQELLFVAQDSKLGRAHEELVAVFRCDVQEVSKEASIAQQKNGGKLRDQLEALARVEHVTPRYCAMRPLIAGGVSSATEIADMPDEAFVETFKTPQMSKADDTESPLLLLFKRWLNWRMHAGRDN